MLHPPQFDRGIVRLRARDHFALLHDVSFGFGNLFLLRHRYLLLRARLILYFLCLFSIQVLAGCASFITISPLSTARVSVAIVKYNLDNQGGNNFIAKIPIHSGLACHSPEGHRDDVGEAKNLSDHLREPSPFGDDALSLRVTRLGALDEPNITT